MNLPSFVGDLFSLVGSISVNVRVTEYFTHLSPPSIFLELTLTFFFQYMDDIVGSTISGKKLS